MSLCISHSDDMHNDSDHAPVDLPGIWLNNCYFQLCKDGLETSHGKLRLCAEFQCR